MANFIVISKSYKIENYLGENPLRNLLTSHYDWVKVNKSVSRKNTYWKVVETQFPLKNGLELKSRGIYNVRIELKQLLTRRCRRIYLKECTLFPFKFHFKVNLHYWSDKGYIFVAILLKLYSCALGLIRVFNGQL